MQPLSKKKSNDEVFAKLRSGKNMPKEIAEKVEKAKKSLSISELPNPDAGERSYTLGGCGCGTRGGRNGGRFNQGDSSSYASKAPNIQDLSQFPTLGGKRTTNQMDLDSANERHWSILLDESIKRVAAAKRLKRSRKYMDDCRNRLQKMTLNDHMDVGDGHNNIKPFAQQQQEEDTKSEGFEFSDFDIDYHDHDECFESWKRRIDHAVFVEVFERSFCVSSTKKIKG